MMDIIKPVSDKPTPAIVFVSGNGWRSIDRAALIPQLAPIAKAGHLVATIDYRIIGEAIFPEPLKDVKTAIRFLRANAKIYNIDADHIGIWGNSAGGHLSAMAATTGDIKRRRAAILAGGAWLRKSAMLSSVSAGRAGELAESVTRPVQSMLCLSCYAL